MTDQSPWWSQHGWPVPKDNRHKVHQAALRGWSGCTSWKEAFSTADQGNRTGSTERVWHPQFHLQYTLTCAFVGTLCWSKVIAQDLKSQRICHHISHTHTQPSLAKETENCKGSSPTPEGHFGLAANLNPVGIFHRWLEHVHLCAFL